MVMFYGCGFPLSSGRLPPNKILAAIMFIVNFLVKCQSSELKRYMPFNVYVYGILCGEQVNLQKDIWED